MSCDSSLSYKESKKLAKRLRREDPQQFQTLVRMHLSFVLDLTMDETDGSEEKTKFRPLKWGIVPFSKKVKGPEREQNDSQQITKDIVKQIYNLVEYLSKEENVSQEGIFRRSGKVTRQQELKSQLQQGLSPKLNDSKYSVHDIASVLKSFLAELPEPLLTDLYYPAYCQIAGLCKNDKGSKARVLRALQLLFLLLPFENRRVLKNVIGLLSLTANYVARNKMSAQNLSTLFTPHLICPRKLTPEVFHTTAQSLSCVVVFIINQFKEVFEIPPALATDIKAYWDRRRLTPNHVLERSISESTAAKTVFSFVDRERTAQENVVNPTETALAQLYAHIQGLPESNKKKRLIKQFNKENGQGTPRTKNIGVSIKKHIFCKNAKAKGFLEFAQFKNGESSSDELINSPENKTPKIRKGKVKFDEKCDKNNSGVKRHQTDDSECDESPPKLARDEMAPGKGGWCSPLLITPRVTSTPAPATGGAGFHTPSPLTPVQDDMSPITRSAQRMPKAMQEAMITPRSRKPVVALSGSNLCQLGTNDWSTKNHSWQKQKEGSVCNTSEESLTSPFRDYLFSRSVLTTSPVDLSFSSQPGDFDPSSSGGEQPLTDSLLYFLDGESPPSLMTSSGTPQSESSLPPITETAL